MDDVSGCPPGAGTDWLLMEAARSTHAAQLLVDPAGRLVVASRRAEEDLGVRPEDVGRPLRHLDVAHSPIELEPLLERALGAGQLHDVRGIDDDSGRCWDVLLAPLAAPGSAGIGLSITFHDVTAATTTSRGLTDTRDLLSRALADLRATGEELQSASTALSMAVGESEHGHGPVRPVLDQELHRWSAGLRARSASVRGQAARSRDRRNRAEEPPAEPPSLGEVPVTDLFIVLVETHELAVRDAVRRLVLGLLKAGYPADADVVGASDAMDILESVLGEA